ncbi:MAG: KpsF/GutQ family sugar-phosphate isomerase [Pseudomonadota bacterium]
MQAGQGMAAVTPQAEESQILERDALASAKRVLQLEADALLALEKQLDSCLVDAMNAILGVSGRVIVTGMGKSGHIARKIAATLASTGTPALFVHPGEASHGDLGMVAREDAVLALSNSGNTAELSDIVAYTRRFQIPLIAMTSGATSQLAEQSDVCLLLAKAPEACPLGLAPTTSTTMMLALGDALAVGLLERRGFSQDDFKVYHPGGSLGTMLLRVSELMHGEDSLPLCLPHTAMPSAIKIMTSKQFGCVGVVDDHGKLVGVMTDGDLRRNLDRSLAQETVGDVMTKAPKTIRARALAAEALQMMDANKITVLFVVDEGRPVGLIQLYDCLRAGVV